MITALVPGSFDPPTNGHLDVIERCVGIFDEVMVAVISNRSKQALFTNEERVVLLEESCAQWPNLKVGCFSGRSGDDLVIRGNDAVDRGYVFGSDRLLGTRGGVS